MQQMLRCGLTTAFLLLAGWQDIRSRRIWGGLFFVFGIIGIIVNIIYRSPWQMCIGGILPGAGMLLLGVVTREQVGYGDGLALIVTGLLLPGKNHLALFLTALFLCAAYTVVLFFAGKWKRRMTLPFLPFLAAAFGMYLLFCADAFRING